MVLNYRQISINFKRGKYIEGASEREKGENGADEGGSERVERDSVAKNADEMKEKCLNRTWIGVNESPPSIGMLAYLHWAIRVCDAMYWRVFGGVLVEFFFF